MMDSPDFATMSTEEVHRQLREAGVDPHKLSRTTQTTLALIRFKLDLIQALRMILRPSLTLQGEADPREIAAEFDLDYEDAEFIAETFNKARKA